MAGGGDDRDSLPESAPFGDLGEQSADRFAGIDRLPEHPRRDAEDAEDRGIIIPCRLVKKLRGGGGGKFVEMGGA